MVAAAAGSIHAGQARAHRSQRATQSQHGGRDPGAHAVPDHGGTVTRAVSRTAAAKGVPFSASPVLEVKLPSWRSRVVLFGMFAGFAALAGRALWLQGLSTDFLQKQGASRYARTLELPATRGKITDRNGQVLASSLPVKAVWAIPDDVQDAPPQKLRELAKLLGLTE